MKATRTMCLPAAAVASLSIAAALVGAAGCTATRSRRDVGYTQVALPTG